MSAAASKRVSHTVPSRDYRVRVAAAKRDRMRARLAVATQEAYLRGEANRTPVIDDVIREARVSRGTFYKYFDSFEEALEAIGRASAQEMLASFERVFASVSDPAVRVAAGPLMALARAAMEPRHGAFISKVDFVDFLDGADPHAAIVKRCLTEARSKGVLWFESLDAAVDVVVGTSLEGMRRMVKGRALNGAYMRETVCLVMIALGLKRRSAQRVVSDAWQHLQKSSASLSWWRADHVG